MYPRPPPGTGYQAPQLQTVQTPPYRQGFASASPVVAHGASARSWDGNVLQCCGRCDGSGWATCLIGTLFPWILCGKLRERSFGQSCFGWGLLFFLLSALLILSTDEIGHYKYNNIPRWIKTASLICLGMAMILLGASTRSAIRRRFGLPGSDCKDFWLWCCCPWCSLCQEARTLELNNVNDGEWFGRTRYLPVLNQPPTPPQPHTPRTPPPLLLPSQPHAPMYGYHNQYQPPLYQPAGYHTIPSPASVASSVPTAPPVHGIPILEADHQAPKV